MTKAPKKAPKEANLKPPWKKGESGNPKGKVKGQRSYSTIAREAIKKMAESQNMTPEEFEELLTQSGLKQALRGNYQFYRDHQDRVHGKPLERKDHTTGGEKIGTVAEVIAAIEASRRNE